MFHGLPHRALTRLRALVLRGRLGDWAARRRLRVRHPDLVLARSARVGSLEAGRGVVIGDDAILYEHNALGDYTYLAESACLCRVRVGKYGALGPRCLIGLPEHPTRGFVSSHPRFYLRTLGPHRGLADRDYFATLPVTTLGHDVWIGAGAMVKSGLTIGNGAIIGAGAVVTHDVPAYAVCAGVPARVLRYRFDPATIAFLQRFCWWDRDEAWLAEQWRKFHDVHEFVAAFGASGEDVPAPAPERRAA